MRIALSLEYDGRGFCGFQSQRAGCGVQDALEGALAAIAGCEVRVAPAGRTDAGVHATAQIVHADVPDDRPTTAWVRGVNAQLPEPIVVRWAIPVDAAFHARYSATARHYAYVLLARPERPGLIAGRAGWYHRPLDVAAMRSAAPHLLGEHDFSSFRAAGCQARSPVKSLSRLDIGEAGDILRFDFSANAFLHHMVRNIVGALVAVGAGKAPPVWVAELLAARDRTRAAPTFAPDGLYFVGADYPPEFALPPTRRDVTLVPA